MEWPTVQKGSATTAVKLSCTRLGRSKFHQCHQGPPPALRQGDPAQTLHPDRDLLLDQLGSLHSLRRLLLEGQPRQQRCSCPESHRLVPRVQALLQERLPSGSSKRRQEALRQSEQLLHHLRTLRPKAAHRLASLGLCLRRERQARQEAMDNGPGQLAWQPQVSDFAQAVQRHLRQASLRQ